MVSHHMVATFTFAHVAVLATSVARITYRLKQSFIWTDDILALTSSVCDLAILLGAWTNWKAGFQISLTQSRLSMASYFGVIWLSRASLAMSTARRFKTSGQQNRTFLYIAAIFVVAGVSYGTSGVLLCARTSSVGTEGMYSCHPPTLVMFSALTSDIFVDMGLIIKNSDIFLEGFSWSLQTISLHRKLVFIAFISSALILISSLVTTLCFLVKTGHRDIELTVLINLTSTLSILSANIPVYFEMLLWKQSLKDDVEII